MSELQSNLLPLLAKYKVQAYICGHDHIGEHLQMTGYETQFFVVGAGTMVDTANAASTAAELIWAGPSYASFASINATLADLTIAYRDTNGTLRYNYTLTNPNPNFVPVGGGTGGGHTNGTGGGVGAGSNDGDDSHESMLSWSYWVNKVQSSSQFHIAMASGGVAALGMMLFFCFVFYKRRSKQEKEKATKRFLLQARTREMVHSPGRGGAKKFSAFYGRKKYSELMEICDLEEGGGSNRDGHHRQDTDYFSDEDDDYIHMAPAAAITATAATTVEPTSTESSHTTDDFTTRSRTATSVHSRSSSVGSFASSTHHGRYSHSLSDDQNAVAAAWLETHPRKASWTGIFPPPPSPGGDHHSGLAEHIPAPGSLHNPQNIAHKASPPKDATLQQSYSPPKDLTPAPSPPKGSTPPKPTTPRDLSLPTDTPSKPPKRSAHQVAGSRMSSSEGISMDPMSAANYSHSTALSAEPPSTGRVYFSPPQEVYRHRRLYTAPV